ncbi:ankyrin repeat domain-containing protein [Thalassotalea sp. G20_0]|uniref:ankyrin repeat domain-containing protein n=1 Tax=Thalassotalea sp. G20_0 TaxID=2821093 RepID=UPI001ADCC0F8|nr:ankyrin repeat domain-containing protein [Thalassotalea sp. G20_0]
MFSYTNPSTYRTYTFEFSFTLNPRTANRRTDSNPGSNPPSGTHPETIRVNFNGKRVRETTPTGNLPTVQPHESFIQTLFQRIVRLSPFAREAAYTPCLDIDLDDDDTTSENASESSLPFPQLPFKLPLDDGQEISVEDFQSLFLRACSNDNAKVINHLAQAVPSSTFMRLTTTGAGENPALNPFARAAISGNKRVLSYLCATFPDARIEKQEALHWAVKNRQSKSVEILCKEGKANPDSPCPNSLYPDSLYLDLLYPDGLTALQKSMEIEDIDTMRVLLSAGANVKRFYHNIASSYFYKAFKQGNNDIISMLISAVPDVNKPIITGGIRLLHLAAWSGNLEMIDHLIKRNARIDLSTGRRNGKATPMHFAALEGHQLTMFKLIDNGGNLYKGKASINKFFWYIETKSHNTFYMFKQHLLNKSFYFYKGGTPLELYAGFTPGSEAESHNLQATLINYMGRNGKSL